METENMKLNNCPFCKGRGAFLERETDLDGNVSLRARCLSCHSSITLYIAKVATESAPTIDSLKLIVEAWNNITSL